MMNPLDLLQEDRETLIQLLEQRRAVPADVLPDDLRTLWQIYTESLEGTIVTLDALIHALGRDGTDS
jgi:hypothetical protein